MTRSPFPADPAEVPAMTTTCESCKLRPATVRVRWPSDSETFRVCDACAHLAEGTTATVLALVEGQAS